LVKSKIDEQFERLKKDEKAHYFVEV